ncbi:MAG: hypothetical protein K1X47_12655 [Cyclobacteriaceae bacterium]|nr:hypothetical protein [Cyclobacteriaceae bacterium]
MQNLIKFLPILEKLLLVAFLIGVILHIMHVDTLVVRFSLIGLGVTLFLNAYRPVELKRDADRQFDFQDLLALTIIPKILWIGSAVSALGFAFSLSAITNNQGYRQMLLVGGLSCAGGTLCLLLLYSRWQANKQVVFAVLKWAIPLMLLDVYLLFR